MNRDPLNLLLTILAIAVLVAILFAVLDRI